MQKKHKHSTKQLLHLFPPDSNGWAPKVDICSALEKQYIDKAWKTIETYLNWIKERGALQKKRKEQNRYWFHQMIKTRLENDFYKQNQSQINDLEQQVIEAKLSPSEALCKLFCEKRRFIHAGFHPGFCSNANMCEILTSHSST